MLQVICYMKYMKIIKVQELKIIDLVSYLRAGKILAMPTETAYGLIADSRDKQAI